MNIISTAQPFQTQKWQSHQRPPTSYLATNLHTSIKMTQSHCRHGAHSYLHSIRRVPIALVYRIIWTQMQISQITKLLRFVHRIRNYMVEAWAELYQCCTWLKNRNLASDQHALEPRQAIRHRFCNDQWPYSKPMPRWNRSDISRHLAQRLRHHHIGIHRCNSIGFLPVNTNGAKCLGRTPCTSSTDISRTHVTIA